MSEREIPKVPSLPELSPQKIELVTELCFKKDNDIVPRIKTLFVFGTAVSIPELAEELKKILGKHHPEALVITGGIESYPDARFHSLPESKMIYEMIKEVIPKDTKVHLETESENTYENVFFSLPFLEKAKAPLCFLAKNFHTQRAYLTLKRFLPESEIYQHSYAPIYPTIGSKLTKDNWPSHPESKARVWGEYLRIKKYGERGDLPIEGLRGLIQSIEK